MAETASAAALSADDKGASMESSVGEVVAAALACKDNGPAMADALLVLRTKLVSDGEAVAAFVASGQFAPVLEACKAYIWDKAVQLETLQLITAVGASDPDAAGAAGAVEGAVRIMEATDDDLACALNGVRALVALTASRTNLARAKLAGADNEVSAILDMYSRDGELQFRAAALAKTLGEMNEAQALEAAPPAPKVNKWMSLRTAVAEGRASELAKGSLPGFSGVSAVVADKAREGIAPLMAHLAEGIEDAELSMWALDAAASAIEGSEERAAEAVAAGFPALLADSLRRHRWQEPAAEAGIRAVLAFGPLAAAPCTAAEVVQALLDVMRASDASHQIQSTGVRAIHCLTSQHAPALRAALEDGAVPIVRAAIDTNPEDGQLQWRGMNLLDALKPGQGEDVRKRALQRSFSSFLRRKDSKAQMGGSFVERKPGVPSASADALKEVDAMAQVVEEDGDEDEED